MVEGLDALILWTWRLILNNIKKILKKIIKVPVLFLYQLFILTNKVDKNSIIFESNLGRNYSGNPRFIYEEMVRRGLDKKYKCYFILENLNTQIPGHVTKIKRISFSYFFILAKAGFWVCDTRLPSYIKKKKDTIYIQTWHGTPLKRLALDLFDVSMEGETSLEVYKEKFAKNTKTWDYLLSQNEYSTKIFKRAFAYDKEILEIGYPRNDILINQNNSEVIKSIKTKFSLPFDKKIILYAPTWRDNEYFAPHQYKFSGPIDFTYMKECLGKDYIILVKAHYLVSEQIDYSRYNGFLYQFGAAYDIAELYLISDLLITDYSSVMFDYSILQRPILFYTYDLENYKDKLRGFYFDFMEEAPGPITVTTEKLVTDILAYDYQQYYEKYQAFRKKYNYADSGEASGRVVDLILSYGGKKV